MIKGGVILPKVSIIVPIYNDGDYLEQSLRSALGQTLEDIEVICIDDGSTDGSREIIERLASEDIRLKPLFHPVCMSASQARKDGVAASAGEYIMFLDGDDELVPEACETACAAIEELKTDMVEFDTEVVNCGGMLQSRIDANQRRLKPRLERIDAGDLVETCFVDKAFSFTLWNKIYRGDICRAAFADIEDGSFPKAQDLYGFFVIAYYAQSYQGIDSRLYRYCFGRGVTGGDVMSLEKFDVLLQEKKVSEALRRFAYGKDAEARLASALVSVENGFLLECVDRWLQNLSAEWTAEGFDHLVDVWGMENVICKLAERHWYDIAVPKKILQTERFRHEVRNPGKRLHVAYYYRSIKGGGAQRVAAELCSLWAGMVDEGGAALYDVTLITDGSPMDDEYFLDPRVRREYLPDRLESARSAYRDRYRAWQRIIKEDGLDIVVSGMWVDIITQWDAFSVKSAPGRPAFIVHCHNFTMVTNLWEGSTFCRLMYLYQLYDGAAVLSECDRSYVGCFCANTRYIPNPVTYVAENTPSWPEGRSIIWTGRIVKEKQPMDLIYMMEKVVQKVPDARLYIVGEGDEELSSRMREEASRLGLEDNIVFTGFTTDVDSWYRKGSVFVNTSSYEGFSMTIAEAFSHSLPVVMYDLPWLEFVRDGRGLRVVEQGRYDLLAREVVRLLGDPSEARRLGREGRGQVDELLQADIGGKWRALFEGIDPVSRQAGWKSDERVLFQFAAEWQEKTKSNVIRSRDKEKKKSSDLLVKNQRLLKQVGKRDLKTEEAEGIKQLSHKNDILKREVYRLSTLLTARVDLKNWGDAENDLQILDVSDQAAEIARPQWLNEGGNGHGCIVRSISGNLYMRVQFKGDGKLNLRLRSQDVRDEKKNHIPVYIDYTELAINGHSVFHQPECVCHDHPFKYDCSVKDGEVMVISYSWHSHDQKSLEEGADKDGKNEIAVLKTEQEKMQEKLTDAQESLTAAEKSLEQAEGKAAQLEEKVSELQRSNEILLASTTWKAGRAVTWLPRKLKDRRNDRRKEKEN